MNIRPEDRAKSAVMLVLIVVVMAYAVKTFLGARHSHPAPITTASVTSSAMPAGHAPPAPGAAALATPATQEQKIALAALYLDGVTAPLTRDPFKPPLGIFVPPPPVKKVSGPLPPQGPIRLPAPVAPPPLQAVTLKGVIDGTPPMAVLELGSEIHYVQSGGTIQPGASLSRVTEAGVVIRSQGRDIPLQVGHTYQPAPSVAGGLNVRPLPSPPPAAGPRSAAEGSVISDSAASGTGITELPPPEWVLPGRVPYQIASLTVPAAPSSEVRAHDSGASSTAISRKPAASIHAHRRRHHRHHRRRHRRHRHPHKTVAITPHAAAAQAAPPTRK